MFTKLFSSFQKLFIGHAFCGDSLWGADLHHHHHHHIHPYYRQTPAMPSNFRAIPSNYRALPQPDRATTEQLPSTSKHRATTEQLPSNFRATTEHCRATTEHYRATTEQLPSNYRALPSTSEHRATTEQLPSNYRALPSNYRALPNNYRATTEQLPSTSEHRATTEQLPSNYRALPSNYRALPSNYRALLMGRAGVFDTKSGKLKRVACKLSQKWRFWGKCHAGGVLPRFGESRRFWHKIWQRKLCANCHKNGIFGEMPRRGYFTEVWGEPVFFKCRACMFLASWEKWRFWGDGQALHKHWMQQKDPHICLDTSCVAGGPLRKESMCS